MSPPTLKEKAFDVLRGGVLLRGEVRSLPEVQGGGGRGVLRGGGQGVGAVMMDGGGWVC